MPFGETGFVYAGSIIYPGTTMLVMALEAIGNWPIFKRRSRASDLRKSSSTPHRLSISLATTSKLKSWNSFHDDEVLDALSKNGHI